MSLAFAGFRWLSVAFGAGLCFGSITQYATYFTIGRSPPGRNKNTISRGLCLGCALCSVRWVFRRFSWKFSPAVRRLAYRPSKPAISLTISRFQFQWPPDIFVWQRTCVSGFCKGNSREWLVFRDVKRIKKLSTPVFATFVAKKCELL